MEHVFSLTYNLIGSSISLIFFILTYSIIYKEIYLKELLNIPFISFLKNNGYLNFIGLESNSFISSDYFPIVPWIFLFFAGGFIGGKIKKEDILKEKFSNENLYLLKIFGRHSLLIYMVHIPTILRIFHLIKYMFP